jgi:hypothetical protein
MPKKLKIENYKFFKKIFVCGWVEKNKKNPKRYHIFNRKTVINFLVVVKSVKFLGELK